MAGSALQGDLVSDADRRDIEASLGGDDDAFARLVRRYQSRISNLMWRFSRDPVTRDDLVQEVFVETYYSLAGFKGQASFGTWITRIATRVGYRHFKRLARERKRSAELHDWRHILERPATEQEPTDAAQALYELFETLPAKERLALTLFYYQEHDTAEIAELTGWSLSLVKVRLFRGRKKLKALLEQEGFGSVSDE